MRKPLVNQRLGQIWNDTEAAIDTSLALHRLASRACLSAEHLHRSWPPLADPPPST